MWGSEPTYKGLKQTISLILVGKVKNSSEPTYKGLKLMRSWIIKKAKNCSEPTYKGLKLKINFFIMVYLLNVPSLPIRD